MKFLKSNFSGIVMCLFEVLVGILLLMNPIGFTSGIIIGVGVIFMVMGLESVIQYFRTNPEEAMKSQLLLKGLILLLLGGFCALKSGWFVITFPVLTLIYGVVILISGLAKIQWIVDIIRMKKQKWFLAGISALISIVCGVVVISSPFSSTAVLWVFTGVSLIVEAVFDVVAVIFGNKAGSNTVKEQSEPENVEGEDVEK